MDSPRLRWERLGLGGGHYFRSVRVNHQGWARRKSSKLICSIRNILMAELRSDCSHCTLVVGSSLRLAQHTTHSKSKIRFLLSVALSNSCFHNKKTPCDRQKSQALFRNIKTPPTWDSSTVTNNCQEFLAGVCLTLSPESQHELHDNKTIVCFGPTLRNLKNSSSSRSFAKHSITGRDKTSLKGLSCS